MITMKELSNKLYNYNINCSIYKNCEIIDFKYVSKKITAFNKYCLYIIKSSNLPDKNISQYEINFLILKDSNLPSYLTDDNYKNKYNYIIIEDSNLSIYKLMYIIQDIFNINSSLISFREDIINAIGNNKSLDEIIKISFMYLKNPIMLLNSQYHTCSYYLGDTVIDDKSWQYQLKNGIPHPTYSLLCNKSSKTRKLGQNNEEIITTFFPEIMKYNEITLAICRNNFIIATINILECNKSVDKSDLEILKLLGKLIYPLLLCDIRFLKKRNSNFNNIMTYLLDTPNPNEVFVKNSLLSLNIPTSNNMYLILLEDRDNMNSKSKMIYLKQYISSLFSEHLVFLYENKIVVVFNNKYSFEKFYKSKEYKAFMESVNNYTLQAGVSKLFNNFLNLKTAYNQASKAIFFGNNMDKKDNNIYFFDDYIIFNLLSSFLEKDNLNNILDSKLKKLILSNNHDLYYTLFTYIKCHGDLKDTSDKLKIHYNTLKYRLQKIESLYDMNLNDKDYLLKLKLSFMSLSLEKRGIL